MCCQEGTNKRLGEGVKLKSYEEEPRMYEVDVFIDGHALVAGKSKYLDRSLHILADNVDLVKSGRADSIMIMDIDNNCKVLTSIHRFDFNTSEL